LTICADCSVKCRQNDERCPLCRAVAPDSSDEVLRRLQKHADEGHAKAQMHPGNEYQAGGSRLKKSLKRAGELFERAAEQGYAPAQNMLGCR